MGESSSEYLSRNVSNLVYHFVCPAKYRRVIFTDVVDKALAQICEGIELRYEWIRFLEIGTGIDSNTTFAAANGVYDQYTTFSYISMYRESVDAEKSKEISDRFNVPHKVYRVPETNEEVPDFEIYKAILEHNDGDIGSNKDSDVRKKGDANQQRRLRR